MSANINKIEIFEKPQESEILSCDKDDFLIDYRTIGYNTDYMETFHYHKYYEFELVCAGDATHKINDRELRVKKGYLTLLKKLDCHAYHFNDEEQLSLYSLTFSDRCISPLIHHKLIRCFDDTDFFLDQEEFIQIKSLFDILYKLHLEKCENFVVVRDSVLNVLLTLVFQKVSMVTAYDETMYNIKKAIMYLSEHFSDHDLSLTKLADEIGLSQNYLGLLFKRKLNVGFNEYIRQLRLNYALRLLKQGGLSLNEISEKCGFNSKSYFIAIFKKQYGITPKIYKEKNW